MSEYKSRIDRHQILLEKFEAVQGMLHDCLQCIENLVPDERCRLDLRIESPSGMDGIMFDTVLAFSSERDRTKHLIGAEVKILMDGLSAGLQKLSNSLSRQIERDSNELAVMIKRYNCGLSYVHLADMPESTGGE